MIHLPNNHPYIIAFTQGSSGRFVKYLLTNLLTNSSLELNTCPITNSTHVSDRRYTGYVYNRVKLEDGAVDWGQSSSDIWHVINFDDPPLEPGAPKIFATHRFPDFKTIKERFGPNVKFIIVTIEPKDLVEVVINDKLKNYYDMLSGTSRDNRGHPILMKELIRRYERFVGKHYPLTFVKEDIIQIGKSLAIEHLTYFLSKATNCLDHQDQDAETRLETYMNLPPITEYPMDQVLLLPYSEIATKVDDGYVWLKKLEQFTNKKANEITQQSYQNYINGRNELIKEYRF